jgi:DNA-binding PucR family transcriptional regulator
VLARRLGADDVKLTVGATGPVVPAAGLHDTHVEARRLTDALAAIGMRAGSGRDLGFAGLVTSAPADVDRYLDRVLGAVAEYDDRRGSDLLGTLEAYFAVGGSPRRAAGLLHVHVNTVAQRLERVASLLGEGWQCPDRALEIQLALRLRKLRGS